MTLPKKILVANHYLHLYGGSESFSYSICHELARRGFEIDLFSLTHGLVSEKASPFARIVNDGELAHSYEFALVSHTTCVEHLRPRVAYLVQTCHGIFPALEQPSPLADAYVAVSEEVHAHLGSLGYSSTVIPQGIDCERFRPENPVNDRLTKVLSLCHGPDAQQVLSGACRDLGVELAWLNKHQNPIWDVEGAMNAADLVVGLGRSAAEAMACARNVLVFDSRVYAFPAGDGMLSESTREESLRNNFSGRRYRKTFTPESLASELMRYDPQEARRNREFALRSLNLRSAIDAYLRLYPV